MRLLNATTYEFQEYRHRGSRPPYAILSHRWFSDEIEFNKLELSELQNEDLKTPQLNKIRGTCHLAREEGLKWVWIDSCCINKDSSEELNRSINSMFMWYREADVCYTYLSDVVKLTRKAPFQQHNSKRNSEWFERGWTLQELLAPRKMKIFDMNWVEIGSRADLAADIQSVTGIEARFLDGSESFRSASIATRLSWQSKRTTTEEEDMAYSLLGIFDVDLVPTYGEGKRAFLKLQQKLVQNYRDESIFAWVAPGSRMPEHNRDWGHGEWGLLAPWVDCFEHSGDIVITGGKPKARPAGGIAPTPEGVKFPMPMKELDSFPTWMLPIFAFLPLLLGPFVWTGIRAYRHKIR